MFVVRSAGKDEGTDMMSDHIRSLLPCECPNLGNTFKHLRTCPVDMFDRLVGREAVLIPENHPVKKEGLEWADYNIQELIEAVWDQLVVAKSDVHRLVDYIRELEYRKPYRQQDLENRQVWDSYVNSMLNASPGLTVETAVKLADRILEYRLKKFEEFATSSNS